MFGDSSPFYAPSADLYYYSRIHVEENTAWEAAFEQTMPTFGGDQRPTKETVASPGISRSRGRGHISDSANIQRWQRISRLIQHRHRHSRQRDRGHSREIANISAVFEIMPAGRAGWDGAHVQEKKGYALSFSSSLCSMKSDIRKEYGSKVFLVDVSAAFEL